MKPIDALMQKCQQLQTGNEELKLEVADWISVFGHISESPDDAGNMINERMDGLQTRIKELEATLEMVPPLLNQVRGFASDCFGGPSSLTDCIDLVLSEIKIALEGKQHEW